jgi:hypothetical protein
MYGNEPLLESNLHDNSINTVADIDMGVINLSMKFECTNSKYCNTNVVNIFHLNTNNITNELNELENIKCKYNALF